MLTVSPYIHKWVMADRECYLQEAPGTPNCVQFKTIYRLPPYTISTYKQTIISLVATVAVLLIDNLITHTSVFEWKECSFSYHLLNFPAVCVTYLVFDKIIRGLDKRIHESHYTNLNERRLPKTIVLPPGDLGEKTLETLILNSVPTGRYYGDSYLELIPAEHIFQMEAIRNFSEVFFERASFRPTETNYFTFFKKDNLRYLQVLNTENHETHVIELTFSKALPTPRRPDKIEFASSPTLLMEETRPYMDLRSSDMDDKLRDFSIDSIKAVKPLDPIYASRRYQPEKGIFVSLKPKMEYSRISEGKAMAQSRGELRVSPIVTCYQWAVTLVTSAKDSCTSIFGGHALIVIEGIKDGRCFLEFADISAQKGLLGTSPAKVRYKSIDPKLFKYAQKNETWICSRESVEKMISSILDEIKAQEAGRVAVRFNLKGSDAASAGEFFHNCITWAREKLKIVNIHFNEAELRGLIFTNPDRYVAAKGYHECPDKDGCRCGPRTYAKVEGGCVIQ